MKKCILLSLILIVSYQSYSQDAIQSKKGYLGISLGPSFYTGTPQRNMFQNQGVPNSPTDPEISKGQIGFNINMIDAGYTFTDNWGVVFKLQGGNQVSKSDGKVLKSTFGTFMIGPMYSIQVQENMVLDMKFKGGRFFNVLTFNDQFGSSFSNSDFNFGMEAGVTLRYHLSTQTSWINNLDFQNQFGGNDENINRINLTTGVAFRF